MLKGRSSASLDRSRASLVLDGLRPISRQSLPFRSNIRDVGDVILYLLSPLSRFITGQELCVNGGMYMG
jgi:NAD(P)-dependent dehydrogenase (short-subunit alcohol dehydrogenase family)